MSKLFVVYLIFYTLSIVFLLATSYFGFDEVTRWSSGALPEAIQFVAVLSVAPLIITTGSMLFIPRLHFISEKIRKIVLFGIVLVVGLVWLGFVTIGQGLAGWDYNIDRDTLRLYGTLAIFAALLSLVFSLLAVYKHKDK